MEGETIKHRVVAFAEQHPQLLLVGFCALLIILIGFVASTRGWGVSSITKLYKTKKTEPCSVDDELDELIDSIHAKQARRKPQ